MRHASDAIVRLIQFRSELAIVTVLVAGALFGAVIRRALPVPAGPPAVSAAPPRPSSDDFDASSPRNRRSSNPQRPPQVVDPR
jgi:hypothetical protein